MLVGVIVSKSISNGDSNDECTKDQTRLSWKFQ